MEKNKLQKMVDDEHFKRNKKTVALLLAGLLASLVVFGVFIILMVFILIWLKVLVV